MAATVVVSACGGGGGEGDESDRLRDGLGQYGHAPGTVVIGTDSPPNVDGKFSFSFSDVTLMDDGRALAVWRKKLDTQAHAITVWNMSDAPGRWGTERPLPQADSPSTAYGYKLQVNAAGNALLTWATDNGPDPRPPHLKPGPKSVRFLSSGAWEPTVYELGTGEIKGVWETSVSADVTLLENQSFVFSAYTERTPTQPQHFVVVQQPHAGAQEVTFDTRPDDAARFAYFAANRDGTGRFFWITGAKQEPQGVDLRAAVVSPVSGQATPVTLATYHGNLCMLGSSWNTSPLLAATSPTNYAVATMVAGDDERGGCDQHSLELFILDTTGNGMRSNRVRVNAPGTQVGIPALAMDSQGNALAMWVEQPIMAAHWQLKWSASRKGTPWSTPQAAIGNLADLGGMGVGYRIRMAMNDQGQAVATAQINKRMDGPYDPHKPILAYARFDFVNGWTPWKLVADKPRLMSEHVAINRRGEAILVYSAQVFPRWGPAPPSDPTNKIYAYRF
ncbi:hypothetical protein [Eleftheria terrae]|uniref:hypothetical protein n=1 Tax=Eleftheria terrae TaxID=1597781 RepID=UPI00263A708B|nr:hypothetical protein [Eleftheria terrae]WKB56087.1 hypothetical protein N7L95_28950 [Eleftheria terrae]